jgi:3-deoxy-D-manno-octulosonic-acid transferase
MPRWGYTLLVRIILPAVLLWLGIRNLRHRSQRVNLAHRLGFGLARRHDRPVWVHAASVGEVQSAAPLIRALSGDHAGRTILLTSGTATGLQHAQWLFADLLVPDDASAALRFLVVPFDLPGAARRFLQANQPRALILIETELWPNLIREADVRGIPLALISARVSEWSTARYLRFAPQLLRETLSRFQCIAAQSAADANRFIELGAEPGSVTVAGNLKFDFVLPEGLSGRAAALRARVAPARAMWVAGSTHPGEEAQCIAAQRELWQRAQATGIAAPLCVMAPRHPQRFDSVATWLQQEGISTRRHSLTQTVDADTQVLLLDTLGELLEFYAASDAAFVGGSLVPVGGHNLLEPAQLGKPTLTGPYSFNSPEAAQLLESANGLRRVSDAHSLATELWEILHGAPEARECGTHAALAVAANRGATARVLTLLAPML